MSDTTLNINLYVSAKLDDAEAERIATILNEAIEHHGLARVEHEQVPEWRRLVEFAHTQPCDDEPLACVLLDLSRLANKHAGEPEYCLARIVAICEQQVGDGWRADPKRDQHGHPGAGHSVQCVAWMLDGPKWEYLGDRAAAWLATLTGEASQ